MKTKFLLVAVLLLLTSLGLEAKNIWFVYDQSEINKYFTTPLWEDLNDTKYSDYIKASIDLNSTLVKDKDIIILVTAERSEGGTNYYSIEGFKVGSSIKCLQLLWKSFGFFTDDSLGNKVRDIRRFIIDKLDNNF